jgi:hypothetical protein
MERRAREAFAGGGTTMRFLKRERRDRSDVGPLRFEYCCGAECDQECRRQAMHEEFVRMTPAYGMRMG